MTADTLTGNDAEIARGDIYWLAPDPARGSLPGFRHPHVVIQDDIFNRSRVSTVIVCALTTNMKAANEPGNVSLNSGEGNLAKASIAVVSQLSSVAKSALGARIGQLSDERVEQILAGLRLQQASYFRGR